MRILAIVGGAILSGKEYLFLNVADGFRKHNHQIKLIFSGWHNGDFLKKLNENNIENYPIKLGWYYITKPLWTLDSAFHYPIGLIRFLRIKKEMKPDVIYIDSYRAAVILFPFLKEKIIYHVNDPNSHSGLDRFFMKFIQRKVNTFIAASQYIKRDLIETGIPEKKIVQIYNGIDIPEDMPRRYMGNGTIRIGFVALIIPRKGLEDLIQACHILNNVISFELIIYGKGDKEYVASLHKLISDLKIDDKVQWMGVEKNKDKLYTNFDVLVAPTRNEEPFALVALEASAYKTPVIATRSGGFMESIIDEKTGYIVEKFSPKQIAEKIKELYFNPDLLYQLGREARAFTIDNFSSAQMHEKLNALIKTS